MSEVAFNERFALWLDLLRWNRPAGWLLLLWPTLSALWIAADGFPGWHLLVVFTLGTVLMRSVNTASRCQPGKPCAAIHSADSVGHRSSSQPAGRFHRTR